MDDATNLASRFHALFAGLERAHGIYYSLDKEREDGKLTCSRKPNTLVDPVTDALWVEYLAGRNGLGIVPIREDSTVTFGAIDVDVYDGLDAAQIAARLVELNLPLIPCRSKSGGCHVYLFSKVPVSAALMQAKLQEIAAMIGHGTAEIFPKQTALAENDFGSWINVPYFDGDTGTRYGIRADGERLTMEQFLETAAMKAVRLEFFGAPSRKEAKEKETFPDGPPCLNLLAKMGVPASGGNTFLFNIALYHKKALPTGWEDAVAAANQKVLTNPRGINEVNDIVKSVGKKDYTYQCKVEPLKSYCDRAKCQARPYGVGNGDSFPKLGELRMLQTSPAVWFWDVVIDGETRTLELSTEQLQDPNAFQRKCMEQGVMPVVPKRVLWHQTIAATMKNNMLVIEVPEDASLEGQAWELIEQFCTRNEADDKGDILLGRPWTDADEKRTYFRLSDLMRFLVSQQFKEYKIHQLSKVLKSNKKVKHADMKLKGKATKLWSLPAFPKQTQAFDVPDSIKSMEPPF